MEIGGGIDLRPSRRSLDAVAGSTCTKPFHRAFLKIKSCASRPAHTCLKNCRASSLRCQLAALAAEARARTVVLTHITEQFDQPGLRGRTVSEMARIILAR
jgi:hypothetical protein